jgi:acylphosphatase
MESPARVSAHFSGTVQGVGFRYTTRSIAARFPVSGFVKNLPDGRVELVAEGDRNTLETFLQDVRSEMSSYIRDVDLEWSTGTEEFSGFTIDF